MSTQNMWLKIRSNDRLLCGRHWKCWLPTRQGPSY